MLHYILGMSDYQPGSIASLLAATVSTGSAPSSGKQRRLKALFEAPLFTPVAPTPLIKPAYVSGEVIFQLSFIKTSKSFRLAGFELILANRF